MNSIARTSDHLVLLWFQCSVLIEQIFVFKLKLLIDSFSQVINQQIGSVP